MELAELIAGLSRPAAYPFPASHIEVRQTHISVVFLTDNLVYKVKKPVDLGFLDFATLEKRKHYCDEEVRLNRRLAPSVYLGVVPITKSAASVQFEGTGPLIEWAVKMKRLPDDATLQSQLRRGVISKQQITAIAERLARFHRDSPALAAKADMGGPATVARNARENFEQSLSQLDRTVSAQVFERLRWLTDHFLETHHSLFETRSRDGWIRDTHGDLHTDHIYLFPKLASPDDLVIIDCIEFNERFRFADPVADMAFLYMDLKFQGHRGLAEQFADAYFAAAADHHGRSLLPFYSAYRAVVRAKVEGIGLQQPELPEEEKRRLKELAMRHWLVALGELESRNRRPCLILVGGLPGTGKSTLAHRLSLIGDAELIRSDVVRKELAGLVPHQSARSDFGHGIYSEDWSDRTYAECLRRAEHWLFQGRRVIIDGSFGKDARRHAAIQLAERLGVPGMALICQAEDDVVAQRLENRINDASDADWTIYEKAAERWEPVSPSLHERVVVIDTNSTPEHGFAQAQAWLRNAGLSD